MAINIVAVRSSMKRWSTSAVSGRLIKFDSNYAFHIEQPHKSILNPPIRLIDVTSKSTLLCSERDI